MIRLCWKWLQIENILLLPSNWTSCISFRQRYLNLTVAHSKCKNVKFNALHASHETRHDLLNLLKKSLKRCCNLVFHGVRIMIYFSSIRPNHINLKEKKLICFKSKFWYNGVRSCVMHQTLKKHRNYCWDSTFYPA